MPADTVEAKQHAHALIEQLDARQVHAVVRLLEVMIDDEDELTEEDRKAIAEADRGGVVPLEAVLANLGLTAEDWEKMGDTPVEARGNG